MGAILLPTIGLVINLTLIIIFYSKKHIHNEETCYYSKLLLLNTLFILIGLITFFLAKITNNLSLISICQKIYMIFLVILDYYSIKYCFSIFNIEQKKKKIIKPAILIITILASFLIMILPLKVIFYNNILDGEGLSYNIAVIYSLFCYLLFLIITFYLISKKEKIIKLSPFLVLIALYLIGFILRNIQRELIFEGLFYSYILLIMYHTIENPDLKMLKELEFAKNREKQANKIKKDFLSSMSHEIRTPLNVIYGNAQLIPMADSKKEMKELAKEMTNSVDNLLNILNEIIDISRIEANDIELQDKEYSINKELEEIINLFDNKMKTKGLKFMKDYDKIPLLIGNIDILKRVIISILDNAIKYTESGAISLKTEYSDGILNVIIKDTGVGISKKDLKKIFNLFERGEYRDSNVNGLGLGLSISKYLIEMINGKIKINSEENVGTEVIISIKQKEGDKNKSTNC